MPLLGDSLAALYDAAIAGFSQPFDAAMAGVSAAAAKTIVVLIVPVLGVAFLAALLVEFLQVGPVFAPQRAKPNAAHLNPGEGLKRMFSMRNLVEVVKAVIKTVLLVVILIVVIRGLLSQILQLPTEQPEAMAALVWQGTWVAAAWTIFVFFFVAVLDAVYQRVMFIRELRMSRRDLRQEHKETEGDPLIRQKRRELHQEWARHNVLQSVRQANVVVTNPTHVAVALLYDPETTDLPVVTAKGEDDLARDIREVAKEAGVPIMRNVDLARGLFNDIDTDHYVTEKYFVAVAEVLQWAATVDADEQPSR